MKSLHFKVATAFSGWPNDIKQLAVGALCMEPLRPMGLTIHEEIQILDVIESPEHLRAHNGVAFIYGCGGAGRHTPGSCSSWRASFGGLHAQPSALKRLCWMLSTMSSPARVRPRITC